MSEKVIIILIVAVAAIIIVFVLRRNLKSAGIKAAGLDAHVDTHEPEGAGGDAGISPRSKSVNISNNRLKGERNKIDIGRGDVNVEENRLKGRGNEVNVRSDD